jgi:hypothetical protein
MACVLLVCFDDLRTSIERDGALAAAVRQQHSGDALLLCERLGW